MSSARTSSPTADAGLSIDLRVADERWLALGLGHGVGHGIGSDDCDMFTAHVLGLAAARLSATGETAILLTDDAEMHALNKQWRGIDKATDVLSFPGDGPEIPGQPQYLGDIALGYETALRDAESMGRSMESHVAHLLIHGFLHLMGYDHIEPEDAKVMEPLEAELLAALGWPDPYATGPYAGNGET